MEKQKATRHCIVKCLGRIGCTSEGYSRSDMDPRRSRRVIVVLTERDQGVL